MRGKDWTNREIRIALWLTVVSFCVVVAFVIFLDQVNIKARSTLSARQSLQEAELERYNKRLLSMVNGTCGGYTCHDREGE
jgi:hypothetical protein